MNAIQELSARLKAETMSKYDVRLPNPRFDDAQKTLHFLSQTYAFRDMNVIEVPVRLMQHLCTLGINGFEAAAGDRSQHEKEALDSLLDKLWYNFTGTLMRWVDQELRRCRRDELWYSCFQVPGWFIQATKEYTKLHGSFR